MLEKRSKDTTSEDGAKDFQELEQIIKNKKAI